MSLAQLLQNILNAMTGANGQALSIVAIAGTGAGIMLHVLRWSHLFTVIAGICVLFGSSWIMNAVHTGGN